MDFAAKLHAVIRAAKLHAAINRLTAPDELGFVRSLHAEVSNKLVGRQLNDIDVRAQLALNIAYRILPDSSFAPHIAVSILQHFQHEQFFDAPTIYWDDPPSYAELWQIRHKLTFQRQFLDHFDTYAQAIASLFGDVVAPLLSSCPYLEHTSEEKLDGIRFSSSLLRTLSDVPKVVEAIVRAPFSDELDDTGLCDCLRQQLERNLILASGGNPTRPVTNIAYKFPQRSGIDDPRELVDTYLGSTVLYDLFDYQIPFTLPPVARFEHHWIVAPPGVGKSTLLQHLLLHDFDCVARGQASVIVIDSNRDLVKSIERLKRFGPEGDLHGRLVSIDVEDVEWPVSLNIFDLGIDDTADLSPRDREILLNSATAMIDYIFRALIGAEMTSRQSTLFNFTIQLLLQIPHPTLDTLIDLMQPKALEHFSEHVAKLDYDAQRFFELKFDSPEFRATKSQVVDRLFGIKRIRALSRMFSAPKTKLDLFKEMSSGKVVLINAAKSLLQEDGVEIFTRFFLANILLAAEKRQLQPAAERFPTYLFIDECQDVIRRDEKLPVILDQARKLKLAMILAHQRLGQMQPSVLNSLFGSTSIKFAANLADNNASAMAANMGTTTSFLQQQPDHHFAAFVRGTTDTAISVSIPFVDFNKMERMTDTEFRLLRDDMRRKYATAYVETRDGTRRDEPVDPDTTDTDPATW